MLRDRLDDVRAAIKVNVPLGEYRGARKACREKGRQEIETERVSLRQRKGDV